MCVYITCNVWYVITDIGIDKDIDKVINILMYLTYLTISYTFLHIIISEYPRIN